nr:retrovirus-related Pol polyprotein from transposon TNT 1-94 [Tanacetum cinerariifolium]
MYAMMCTRPDIPHALGVVSRFISNTSKATLCFNRKVVVLEGFSDSDYGGCLDSGNSTTVYVSTVGCTTVSWMSRLQKCVAMSTTETKYMAIVEAGKELAHRGLSAVIESIGSAQTELVVFNPASELFLRDKASLYSLSIQFLTKLYLSSKYSSYCDGTESDSFG